MMGVGRCDALAALGVLGLAGWLPAGALPVEAAWMEGLFMPGPVVRAHGEIEDECMRCHRPFDKARQSDLCLDCHTEVGADLAEGTGYHGRELGLVARACNSCHAEHRGRDAKIVPLEPRAFDHWLTDMPLRGAHAALECDGCHGDGRPHREAPADCGVCHAADDPHHTALGAACDLCHREEGWRQVSFDHEQASFALRGKHREADCAGCHPSRVFKPAAARCRSCHATNDRHRGGLGDDCGTCHDPGGWETSFDHAARSGFPLVGEHAAVACERCHDGAVSAAATQPGCASCHGPDDAHRGRFGTRCESCHSPRGWRRTTFEHARDTGFELRGKHREAACRGCHDGPAGARVATACYSCHRSRDVHRGRQGTRCQTCHDERGWSRGVLFDHSATEFPLVGVHARTACTSCHRSARFADVAKECNACHAAEDVHRGEKGERCEGCHTATSWKVITSPPQ